MNKRILSTALSALFIFAIVPITSTVIAMDMPEAQANGFIAPIDDIVPADAIYISTAAELAKIGGPQSEKKYYVLANDIALTEEWVPIVGFYGDFFDGQGHTISNLYVLSSSNRESAGLFDTIAHWVTVKNVGINIGALGVSASASTSTFTPVSAGGLAGNSQGGTIINCFVTGTVSAFSSNQANYSPSYAGGLFGRGGGRIIDCYTEGIVSASDTVAFSSSFAGGLIGEVNGHNEMYNSYSTSEVSASSSQSEAFAGGLIGRSFGGTITNCYAPNATYAPLVKGGDIFASSSIDYAYAGGLIGSYSGGTISGSYAERSVSATSSASSYAGGLIGLVSDGAFTVCYAGGAVSVSASSTSSPTSSYAGGLIGYCDSGIITTHGSYATGMISSVSESPYVGGLIARSGRDSRIVLRNSYYSSLITAGDKADEVGEHVSPWALDGVMNAISIGYVPENIQSGLGKIVTRAEFCRLAVEWVAHRSGKGVDGFLEEKGLTRDPNAFSDTNDPYILAAYALGITNGTGGGKFTPEGSFTREQAATMIRNTCRVAGMDVFNTASASFTDILFASEWAVDAIYFCSANGIMQGTGDFKFNPKATYTREQSIVTFNNI